MVRAALSGNRRNGVSMLSFGEPITLVGGGDLSPETLSLARAVAPTVIAADGGANRLREWDIPTAAVVGDMDSVADAEAWRRSNTEFLQEDEQNSTDLEKCLRLVHAPVYLAVGFLGNRLDHSLAAMGLTAFPRSVPLVLVAEGDIAFGIPHVWEASLPAGARLSIIATRQLRVREAIGLIWPPDGLELDFGTTRGVSNVAKGGIVRLAFDRPGALVVLGKEHLEEAVRSVVLNASRNIHAPGSGRENH